MVDVSLCPLCLGETLPWLSNREMQRTYHRCPSCWLVHVPSYFHLPLGKERERYEHHQNSSDDLEYLGFLKRLAEPLKAQIPPEARGLDFGCGPVPCMQECFPEHQLAHYDTHFFPDDEALRKKYDFVTCSETAEHFRRPWKEFKLLELLIKPGGWLGIMTQEWETEEGFSQWHYPRDPTHIAFFHEKTFEWLADQFHWRLERPQKNIALFQTTPPN